jgi:flavin reductase (DIM6/NTAB) family NADH-FMN oxidoreductase RutF
MYTGAKVDKFERCHLTREAGEQVACPAIAQAPISLECRVTQIIPLGTHDMFLADILCVRADEQLLDENGKLCIERANLAAFAHGEYFALGKSLGRFGFSAVKKGKKRK